jgi:uncharacterized protein (TIGR03435 family)
MTGPMITLSSLSEWAAVGRPLANHLWQSTLFAALVGLVTLFLRKNRAQVRYWLWLAASVKFLLPFSLLIAMGSHLAPSKAPAVAQPAFSVVVQEIGQPFATPTPLAPSPARGGVVRLVPTLLLLVWFSGCLGVLLYWSLRWWRVMATTRAATPVGSGRAFQALRRLERGGGVRAEIKIIASTSALEPGVVGIFRPVLVVPAGVADRLTDAQLEAIIAHELCHIRRRDNLAAMIHMLVEAIFWFHPLAWWVGTRLVDERERACDEEVLRLGSDPETYAEGILKVCQFYLESPLVCVAGVTGSNLKRRIENIMSDRISHSLNLAKKVLLATMGVAAVAMPVVIGVMHPIPGRAQTQTPSTPQSQRNDAAVPSFATVSIKPSDAEHKGWWSHTYPDGRFVARNASLKALIQGAYGINLVSIPDALTSQRYDIDANAAGPAQPDQLKLMLRTLLSTRFKLASHTTTKDMPVYMLAVGPQGPKLRLVDPASDKCEFNIKAPGGEAHIVGKGTTSCLAGLLSYMSQADPPSLDRPVVDHTGIKGVFDFDIPVDLGSSSSFFPAMQQLGLKLEASTAPMETLVVDHAETPSTDSAQAPSQSQSQPPSSSNIDGKQPDEVLFARAKEAMKGARYVEARGLFQTLIQSYPNSEYVPLAKLSIARAWYAEGNLKQAEVEYRDFLTFFPNRPEVAEVQSKLASIQQDRKSPR